jgi:hypothetical protein
MAMVGKVVEGSEFTCLTILQFHGSETFNIR